MSATRKFTIARVVLDTAAVLAMAAVAAGPAYAINQDQTDGTGGVFSADTWAPEPTPSGLDTTSAALGALGGIALGGAGLMVSLGVQRRRDRSAAHPA